MKSTESKYRSVDEYIGTFPPDIQEKLEQLRATIKAAAPEAQEKISYQMPAYHQHGNLVYFAAFTNHISFFPTPSAIEAFKDDLVKYEGSKGGFRIPLDEPLPLGLIKQMVRFRVSENAKKAEMKKGKKKKT